MSYDDPYASYGPPPTEEPAPDYSGLQSLTQPDYGVTPEATQTPDYGLSEVQPPSTDPFDMPPSWLNQTNATSEPYGLQGGPFDMPPAFLPDPGPADAPSALSPEIAQDPALQIPDFGMMAQAPVGAFDAYASYPDALRGVDPMIEQVIPDPENIHDAAVIIGQLPPDSKEVPGIQLTTAGMMANDRDLAKGLSSNDILASIMHKEDALSAKRRDLLLSGGQDAPVTREQMIGAALLGLLPIIGGYIGNGAAGASDAAAQSAQQLPGYFQNIQQQNAAKQTRQDKLTEFDLEQEDKSLQRQETAARYQQQQETLAQREKTKQEGLTEREQIKAGAKAGPKTPEALNKELNGINNYGRAGTQILSELDALRGPDGKFPPSIITAYTQNLPNNPLGQVMGQLQGMLGQDVHKNFGRVTQTELNNVGGTLGVGSSLTSLNTIYGRVQDAVKASADGFQSTQEIYQVPKDRRIQPTFSLPSSSSPQTAYDPKTGHMVTFKDGKWQ